MFSCTPLLLPTFPLLSELLPSTQSYTNSQSWAGSLQLSFNKGRNPSQLKSWSLSELRAVERIFPSLYETDGVHHDAMPKSSFRNVNPNGLKVTPPSGANQAQCNILIFLQFLHFKNSSYMVGLFFLLNMSVQKYSLPPQYFLYFFQLYPIHLVMSFKN